MGNRNGYTQVSRLFKALAHPVRARIVDLLSREEACVCHIADALGKPQPYISQQLAVLRNAGLVMDRREGLLVYYRLADARLADILGAAKAITQDIHREALAFPVVQEPSAICNCPRCRSALETHQQVGAAS
ncbi:MAG: helix-turn-helix transcriptional regulator [Anaerolineae bacterium]|nr:helix-turn-helix transcriptional regulator [Anaerolineae bacterium]